MTTIIPTHDRIRRHLFRGSAAAALACALMAGRAPAQTADVRATAARSLVNDQAEQGTVTRTDTGNAQLTTTVTGATEASSVTLANNDVGATARGNHASQDLELDALDPASAFGPTALTAGAAGITADAATLIVNRQRGKGSETLADNMASMFGIDAGPVSDSRIALTGNTQEAVALGSDATDTLALHGNIGTGAGILSLQTGDATSNIGARSFGATGLSVQDVSASDLAVTGNLERGIAYGNAVANALSATSTSITPPSTSDVASTVPAIGGGDPATGAAYAILSNQSGAGTVKASAGGGGEAASGVIVSGDIGASSLANEGNTLVAAGYGNQSANSLDLDTLSIARSAPGNTGAVANVTNAQRLGDTAGVTAATAPDAVTLILGDTTDSDVSVSHNGDQTIATGNLASGNSLTVKADTIDARQGGTLGGEAVGSALTTPSGDASSSAAFSVQNVQDYGKAGILAGSAGNAADLEVRGTVGGSVLHDDSNTSKVAAMGNSADNIATLDGTTVATSADVNNLQTGDGDVTVSLGSTEHRAGATLTAQRQVTNSEISVAHNEATGTATANSSTNSLTVSAATLIDGSGHGNAQAGPIDDRYGAAATFALANEQKTGEPSTDGSTTPTIAANLIGRFAIDGDGWADQSSLAVEDDLQHAEALANNSVNRLSIAATGRGGGDAPAGAALSSSQYGQVHVTATSDAKFTALSAISDSTVSLSRDTNEAVATVNQADNGMTVDGIGIGSLTRSDAILSSGPLGPPEAMGDHVLANQQFATGSASAVAVTRFIGGGVDASRFDMSDNVTSADAAANRALNAVSVTAATGPVGNAGLVNTQMNIGSSTASAATNTVLIGSGTPLAPAIGDAAISIDGNQTAALARGNAADNRLVLAGDGVLVGSAAAATVQPFDATVHAAGALLNSQANYGSVTATASNTGYSVPLNGSAVVKTSTLAVAGNSVSAAAYGNAASNAVGVSGLGGLPTAAIANVQANYGPVTALVTGASYRIASGPLGGAALSITGNQLAATATGNQATNIIAAQR